MTSRQKRAIAALIRSPTKAEAAKAAGVGVSTLRRWLSEDEAFREAYQAALAELVQDAAAQSKQGLKQALDTIRNIMETGKNDAVRLSAARAAIDAALKIDERADIQMQLEELRREIDQLWG